MNRARHRGLATHRGPETHRAAQTPDARRRLAPIARSMMALAVAALSPSAWSQSEPAQDVAGAGLEEIVVTARRVEESLQSTPVAVTALSAQALEQRNMTDVRELAAAVPNLVLQTSGANGGSQVPAIFIRGLGQADVALTADPAVGLYVDGVYIARNSGNILSLLDLERVEVLRGPQGTLFGKNTIGGAINLVTAKPGADFDMSAELTAGNYERRNAKFSVNLPLTDALFLKLATLGEQHDGYVDLENYPGKALGDSESWAARGHLRWLPTSALTVDFAADFSSTRDVGPPFRLIETFPNAASAGLYNALLSGNPASCLSPAGQASDPACYGPVQVPADDRTSNVIFYDRNLNRIDPDNDFDTFGAALTVSRELPFGTLRSISAYRNLRSGFNFDGDYSATMLIGGYARRQKSDQYSEELQLFGTAFSERLKWLIGGYYFDEDTYSEVEVLSVFALPAGRYPLLTDNYEPTDTTNYAAFGQATYDLTSRLHLTVGGRWTNEKKKAILYTLPQQPQGLPGSLEIDKWTPMISVSADVADHALVYASFAQGFRSGGFPPRVIGQVSEIPSFGPETSTTYEVGLKAEWFERRVRTNLALFTNDFEDFQAGGLAPDITPPLPTVINAGNARIKGAELEISAVPTQALRVDAALSYLTNELTSVNPTTNDSGVPVTRDNKLPYSPEWKASVGVSWILPLPTPGDLVARVDAAYVGQMFFSLGNLPEASQVSVTTLDGSFAYTTPGGRWQFVIGGKNLTDRYYYTVKQTDRVSAGFSAGTYGALAPPRTYFGTMRWRY